MLRDHADGRPQYLAAIAIFAIAVGLLSILVSIGEALDGEIVVISRIALGFLGVAGGALAWIRRGGTLAWTLLFIWAVIQIPVIAWSPAGSPTQQLVRLPLTVTSSRSVNGVVTDYTEYGVNVVGIALAIALYKIRESFFVDAAERERGPAG